MSEPFPPPAPVDILSLPNISSSATLPPKHTANLAFKYLIEWPCLSLSGKFITIPNALPLGMIVALCIGS